MHGVSRPSITSLNLPLISFADFARFQIGPAAGNLGGIREAADRVVSRLQQLIQPPTVTSISPRPSSAKATADKVASATEQDEDMLLDGVANGADNLDEHDDSSEEEPPPSSFTHFGFEALALEG